MATGAQYNSEVTATSSGQSFAFGFKALKVIVVSDGSADTSWSFTTSTGTTGGGHKIKSGESITITAKGNASYDGICCVATTAGGSATVRVLALR